ncbi:MAG: hypothetical protein ACPGRE_07395 [Flavobacteriaceae bacterium]
MKKLFFACILGLLSTHFTANAQGAIEISPFVGYTFSGTANAYNGFSYVDYDIKDAMSYGVTLGAGVGDLVQGEFSYTRVDTRMVRTGGLAQPESFDIGVEYYQLGAVKEFEVQPTLLPFVKASLGANRYFDKAGKYGSDWLFSGVIGVGAKKYFSDRIGFKIYSNFVMPMQFNGLGFWVGTGGASGGASFYVPLVHWDLGGALIFKLDR